MLKKARYSYAGINQDISKSKRDPRFYFDAEEYPKLNLNIEQFKQLVEALKEYGIPIGKPTISNREAVRRFGVAVLHCRRSAGRRHDRRVVAATGRRFWMDWSN